MSSRSIGHARCRSVDDGTHVRRYCIETAADDVCVFTPASRIIWLSESYPTILLHIWLGWRQMLYTAVRLLGVVTHSRQLVHAQLWEEEGKPRLLRQLASADWRSFSYFSSSSFSRKCWHKKKMVASTEREKEHPH